MIRFPTALCDDRDGDWILKQYINTRLLNIVILDIEMTANAPYKTVNWKNSVFQDEIFYYCPHFFSDEDAAKTFLDLLKLLESSEEISLNAVQSFVLHSVIMDDIELCRDTGTTTVKTIPEAEREYLLTVMEEPAIRKYEDLLNYASFCFTDLGFLQMDDYSEKECRKRGWIT